jgi:hypothetical protein
MMAKRAGLVCAGGLHRSFLPRFPGLLATVSVVKASSLRVARRMANSLRAGVATDNYSALAGCDAVWIAVPDSALDQILSDLAKARLPASTVFIMCDTPRESSCAPKLRMASVYAIPPDERILVAEGSPDALRYLRRVVSGGNRRLVEIRAGSKPLFLAGLHLASYIALPWIGAAVESLRTAGFSRADATRIVEDLGARTLRSYAKAGPKAWRPPAAEELRRALGARLADARLHRLYHEGIDRALHFFRD